MDRKEEDVVRETVREQGTMVSVAAGLIRFELNRARSCNRLGGALRLCVRGNRDSFVCCYNCNSHENVSRECKAADFSATRPLECALRSVLAIIRQWVGKDLSTRSSDFENTASSTVRSLPSVLVVALFYCLAGVWCTMMKLDFASCRNGLSDCKLPSLFAITKITFDCTEFFHGTAELVSGRISRRDELVKRRRKMR